MRTSIKKGLLVILLTFSAGLGFGINGSYYRTSFIFSGYEGFYPIALAVGFMTFEAILWIKKESNFLVGSLRILILVYSLSITLGAQFFSTSQKEAQTAEVIFENVDISGDVEYYREQIKVLNSRKDELIQQQLTFGTAKNKELLESTNADIAKYESFLVSSDLQKKESVEEINSPKTLYGWIAYDMPNIFKEGMSEDLIKVIFQMFSSALLALMGPISVWMLREVLSEKIEILQEEKKEDPQKIEPIPEPVKEVKKPAVKKPVKPKADPTEKRNILKMILYNYPDNGLMSPEDAATYFKKFNKQKSDIKAYSIKDCRKVYDEILSKDLNGKDIEEIKKEILQNGITA